MKTVKKQALVLVMALFSTLAFAGGAEDAPLTNSTDIKDVIIENISGMDVAAMRVDDASVGITFLVDTEGKLVLTDVDSDSEFAAAYVKQMLKDVKLNVVETLSNKKYKLNVRYVQL
jgi:hypothetical protein